MAKKVFFVMCCMAMVLVIIGCASSGGLPSFGAEMGSKSVAGKTIRIPYTSTVNYFGYAKPGAAPDAVDNGRNMWYIYIWVPAVAPEIGVRMISPAPKGMEPKDGDFISPLWEEGKNDAESYFDTWISLERANGITSPADLGKAASANWVKYDSNDDSSEMPKNPGGNAYNSLMRVVSETSNPLKALVRGLYRIGFTTYKRGDVKGTFLAQIGAPIALPGVVIGSSVAEIQAKAQN
jgi:hypothetical protein